MNIKIKILFFFLGLFQRAIAHSGSALNPWVVTKCARERAFQLGEILGCKTDNDQLLIDFLRTVPARELLKNSTKVLSREVIKFKFIIKIN